MIRRLWNSGTVTSVGNAVARVAAFSVVLPLVLRKLPPEDAAVFFLISTAMGLQLVLTSGISTTFSRRIAYIMSGRERCRGEGGTVAESVAAVIRTMQYVFVVIALLAMIIVNLIGTTLVSDVLQRSQSPRLATIAWWIAIVGSGLAICATSQRVLLHATSWLVPEQRLSAITSVAGNLTGAIVLAADGGLLGYVIASQSWQVVNWAGGSMLVRRRLAAADLKNDSRAGPKADCYATFKGLWGQTWRSTTAAIMSTGLIYIGGFSYARVVPVELLPGCLLGFKLVQVISEISWAAFAAKLPHLNELRAQGNASQLIAIASRGINHALALYFLSFASLTFLGGTLLAMIGSQSSFPTFYPWITLGVAFAVNLFCNLHLFIYTTTGHIVGHYVTAIAGCVGVLVFLCLGKSLQAYAVPVCILAGLVSFYAWHVPALSYRSLGVVFSRFDLKRLMALAAGFGILVSFRT